jgi:hypothetical protein
MTRAVANAILVLFNIVVSLGRFHPTLPANRWVDCGHPLDIRFTETILAFGPSYGSNGRSPLRQASPSGQAPGGDCRRSLMPQERRQVRGVGAWMMGRGSSATACNMTLPQAGAGKREPAHSDAEKSPGLRDVTAPQGKGSDIHSLGYGLRWCREGSTTGCREWVGYAVHAARSSGWQSG